MFPHFHRFHVHGVDLVFSGHVHAYARSFPVFNYTLGSLAPVHVTVGDGGNVETLQAIFCRPGLSLFTPKEAHG